MSSKFISHGYFLLAVFLSSMATISHARDEECSFTVGSVSVCEISFYKLLAAPGRYDGKYISVKGYMAIDNGRLAVYPAESSYDLGISQDSFNVKIPFDERQNLAVDFNRKNIRIVGLFNYKIIGDQPGIGYISVLIDAYPLSSRPEAPEDKYLSGTPEEISGRTKKGKN
ncbi:MAG: hypothetical protein K8F30_03000 [Taibaiella sp.]|nr:hypothetical protein [Taibaiella sp.]